MMVTTRSPIIKNINISYRRSIYSDNQVHIPSYCMAEASSGLWFWQQVQTYIREGVGDHWVDRRRYGHFMEWRWRSTMLHYHYIMAFRKDGEMNLMRECRREKTGRKREADRDRCTWCWEIVYYRIPQLSISPPVHINTASTHQGQIVVMMPTFTDGANLQMIWWTFVTECQNNCLINGHRAYMLYHLPPKSVENRFCWLNHPSGTLQWCICCGAQGR